MLRASLGGMVPPVLLLLLVPAAGLLVVAGLPSGSTSSGAVVLFAAPVDAPAAAGVGDAPPLLSVPEPEATDGTASTCCCCWVSKLRHTCTHPA
jgi:hypothetical protein